MVCEPASRDFQVMTRSTRMPVLIEERTSKLDGKEGEIRLLLEKEVSKAINLL